MRSLGRAGAVLAHEVMGSPFFRTPSCPRALPIDRPPSPAHNFSLYFQTVTIHPATDPFHAQGNLRLLPNLRFQCGASGRPPSLLPLPSRAPGLAEVVVVSEKVAAVAACAWVAGCPNGRPSTPSELEYNSIRKQFLNCLMI